jgi:hypothetical protein
MELLGEVGQVEAHFYSFVDCVNLGARFYTICTEYTTSMETFLAAPNGPPR